MFRCFLLPIALLMLTTFVDAATPYRKPPQMIQDVLDAPETPRISVSPTRDRALLAHPLRYPPISELAEPMLRLAGVRINPKTNGPRTEYRYFALSLLNLDDGTTREVKLPDGARVSFIRWSPDGQSFAFLNTASDGVELWTGSAADATIRRIGGARVNSAIGIAFRWMPDSETLLVQTVPEDRGAVPEESRVPEGPIVQQSMGSAGPVRTYQDLLKSPHDEALFGYYGASQLSLIHAASGKITAIGEPAVFADVQPSPNGEYLLTEVIREPYSYLYPYYRFPQTIAVWDTKGKLVRKLMDVPLADNIPIQGVRTGPRAHSWQVTQPATLVWAEALDEGDPRNKVPHRDRLVRLDAPFNGEPREFCKVEQRFIGLDWSENDDFALVWDYDRDKRWIRAFRLDPAKDEAEGMLVWSRSSQDRYGDPGAAVERTLASGFRAIMQSGSTILLNGDGASPEGDRPFLDRFDWKSKQTERLFHCAADAYEYVVAVLDDSGRRLLTRRESPTEPPNYYVKDLRNDKTLALTGLKDPVPQIRSITKRRVTYKRHDGVNLSFTLYLPPGYKEGEGEPLPTVMWAYPREYNSAQTAGQIRGSTQRFTLISGSSHLFYLLEGYAILDGATLPVIGDPETANDTYIQQIVAGAKAAIDKAVELGVTDRDRVGVGGHSYGAFMTANLLAHSDLFCAGVARSGAYNRTLTPFGFQAERRTVWEAPQIYFKISPFMSAHKINEPLLMIHGEADNNSGTFPLQSERMYHAVAGNGGAARLVMLPHESHGYMARESIEHTLAEMVEWFAKYVKPRKESD